MRKIALYTGSGKPESTFWAEFVVKKLQAEKIDFYATPELASSFGEDVKKIVHVIDETEFERHADVVISFGGDGTMLYAARLMLNTDIPILGVNVGKLGFLAEFSVKDVEKSIEDLSKGNYRVVDRATLEASLDHEKIHALNDFVIEKIESSRMITVSTFANNHHIADYRADGLIITTPTGSTAYSLSCGGPIIAPSTQVLCITPISPHSLTLRPLVIPDTNEVTLKVYSPTGEVSLVADGQIQRTLKNNDTIIIKRSEQRIKLIKPLNSSYYDLLRAKLLWAANPVEAEIKNS